jgi:hypothetical protein
MTLPAGGAALGGRRADARASARARAAVCAGIAAVLTCAGTVMANGGTLQLSREPAGPYVVTVFTDPSPLRVGEADVSVLVERAGSDDLVQDARVSVTTEPVGQVGRGGTFDATHEQATNKLFYAAKFELPTEGTWRIVVGVSGDAGEGSVAFDARVEPMGLLDRPLVSLVVFVGMPAAIALWWFRIRRARPSGGRSR